MRFIYALLLIANLAACVGPQTSKERVIFYTKDQVSDETWNRARADYENGLIDTGDFKHIVGTIRNHIEVQKLSLEIESRAIDQYMEEKVK